MLYEHLVIKTYDVSKLIGYSLLDFSSKNFPSQPPPKNTRFVSPVRQVTRVEGYKALGGTTRCGGDSAAEVSPEAPTNARKVAAAQSPALNLGEFGMELVSGCPGLSCWKLGWINGESNGFQWVSITLGIYPI